MTIIPPARHRFAGNSFGLIDRVLLIFKHPLFLRGIEHIIAHRGREALRATEFHRALQTSSSRREGTSCSLHPPRRCRLGSAQDYHALRTFRLPLLAVCLTVISYGACMYRQHHAFARSPRFQYTLLCNATIANSWPLLMR